MIVINILMYALIVYVSLIFIVAVTSKGECYFCGKRFGKSDHVIVKVKGKKWCGCDIKESVNDQLN